MYPVFHIETFELSASLVVLYDPSGVEGIGERVTILSYSRMTDLELVSNLAGQYSFVTRTYFESKIHVISLTVSHLDCMPKPLDLCGVIQGSGFSATPIGLVPLVPLVQSIENYPWKSRGTPNIEIPRCTLTRSTVKAGYLVDSRARAITNGVIGSVGGGGLRLVNLQ